MDTLKLGGNIELNGFSNLDGGTMVILKKIIGNHARNLLNKCNNFEKLSLTINVPNEIEKATNKTLFELKGTIIKDHKEFVFESADQNLFFAVDDVMKNLEKDLQKQASAVPQ